VRRAANLIAITHQERQTRCLIPGFDGAFLSSDSKDALWARFFMGAPHDRGGPSSDTA